MMKQLLSFIRKEFYHVFRDSKTLLLLFGMPVVLIVLFGFAVTNEIKNARIGVCDYARDPASQEIINKLSVNEIFQLDNVLLNQSQIETAFRQGDIKLAVVFPAHFYNDLMHLKKAQVQIIADASDPNTAVTLTNYAKAVIMEYQQQLMVDYTLPYSIIPEIRMLYNPGLKGAINFVPGIMALVLMLVCVLMTSISIVKEKEMGTMEVLLVSPMNPFLVIVAKAIPYLALSLINLAVILLLSVTILGLPIHGSISLLVAESTLLILCALSLGLLISNVTQSQQAAMLLALMGLMMPTMLFTGFMFPLESMPKALQLISNIIPAKWYYIITKSIMVKGLGFSAVWKETLVLFGMTCFFLVVSLKQFKIRMD